MIEKLIVIYKITSKINRKFYIGSAVDFKDRVRCHIKGLRKKDHENQKLQNHYNKYGEDDLIFEIVENVENKKDLTEREQFYLDTLNPFFNICKIAGNCTGRKLSEESIAKMKATKALNPWKPTPESIAQGLATKKANGYKPTPETIEKRASKLRGQKRTDEAKQKMSDAKIGFIPHNKGKKGFKQSPETCQKKSEYMKGKPGRALGYKHTDEFKEAKRIASTGRKHTEESKIKMSIAQSNKSEETIRKITIAQTGKKYSEESKKKMSESAKRRFQKPE